MTAKDILSIIRGVNRPYVIYIYSSIFAGLTVYAFIKYGTENMAFALITGFIGIVGTIVGVLFGERASKKPEDK